jgi:hypothetical protein
VPTIILLQARKSWLLWFPLPGIALHNSAVRMTNSINIGLMNSLMEYDIASLILTTRIQSIKLHATFSTEAARRLGDNSELFLVPTPDGPQRLGNIRCYR